MNYPDVDLAIIGGGPAGLISAKAMADMGLHVAVFERGAFPRDKACGEGIMPAGIEALATLGFNTAQLANIGMPFNGICFASHGIKAEANFLNQRQGYGIQRIRLSSWLLEHAKNSGAVVYPEHRLKAVKNVEGNWHITLQAASGQAINEPVEVKAKNLLACDGIRSTTLKLLRLKRQSFASQRIGLRWYLSYPHQFKKVTVYWQNNCEAYVTPLSTELLGVTLLWPHKAAKELGDNPLNTLLKVFSQTELANLPWETSPAKYLAAGPFGSRLIGSQPSKFAAIGDSFCFYDGITGEGITLACQQVRLLKTFFERHETIGGHDWFEMQSRLVSNYIRMTSLALHLSKHPWLRLGVIKAMHVFPGVFSRILEQNMATP